MRSWSRRGREKCVGPRKAGRRPRAEDHRIIEERSDWKQRDSKNKLTTRDGSALATYVPRRVLIGYRLARSLAARASSATPCR